MKKVLTVLSLLFSVSLFAQSLSLTELIDLGLKNNPETERAWASAKRAQAALGTSKSAYYPTLSASGTANHGRELKFPNGPNTNYSNYGGELCLNYLLFDFGERSATVDAAKQALEVATWSSDFTIQRVIYRISASYYEYLDAAELVRTKESSLQDASFIFDAAKELYKVGLKRSSDLSLSKARLAQVQMELAQQKARESVAYGKLMTSLGIPVETKLEVLENPQPIDYPLFAEGIDKLIAAAEEKRADLMAKNAQLAEAQQRVKRANAAPLPKLRALGRGGWLQYNHHQGSSYNYNVGIALEVPLFKGFEYTYNKRLALADEEITSAELKELQEAIALEVLTYSESVKAAQEALKWSDAYLEESQRSYEGSIESYKAGLENIFDLIQAQRLLADARMKKAEVRTQWLVSLAELAFATGSLGQ